MATIISSLHIYPIKSCGGIYLPAADISEAGLRYDRRWMVVAPDGGFLTQRAFPAMARITTSLKLGYLVVNAPGMLRLDIPLEVDEDDDSVRCSVTVWNDTVDAVDEGDLAASWFTEFLGTPCRLVKVHPEARRVASVAHVQAWREAHADEVPELGEHHYFGFADGFPILVANQTSLDDLNQRLVARGAEPVPMDRFRANIVIDGLEAFEEDYVTMLSIGNVRLALVKPCARCPIPNTDQITGEVHHEPGDTLATFRADPERGVLFGQNAVVQAPAGAIVRVGDEVEVALNF
jgi:uncharacterized protein YcbX